MTNKKQDGRASFPLWFRRLLVWLKLSWALALVDKGGAYHDASIAPLGYLVAAVYFAFSMLWNLVGAVAVGIIAVVVVIVYAPLPQKMKDRFWK